MFPKFLRVGACFEYKKTVWINETSFLKKTALNPGDKVLLDIIAEDLEFSYEAKFPSDGKACGWSLANGTWTGVLGMLQRGEVDMVIDRYIGIDEKLNEEFRFIYPRAISESTFVTRKPVQVPNMAMFLHPFSIQVWLAILACVCVVPFIFQSLLGKKNRARNPFTSILGSLVGQGMTLTPRRPREYLVLASWILGSAFLFHFYAAVLLSFVTFPPLQGIRNIEDLANGIKAGKYECATAPKMTYSHYFIETEVSALTIIGHNLKYHDKWDFKDYLEMSGGSKIPAFVGLRDNFLSYKEFYYVPEDNFMHFSFAYVTRKDFCCGLELDNSIHRIWASGIFKKILDDFLFNDFLNYSKYHSKNWENAPSETIFTMALLKGPFIFLIASHSLACLVFLIEICVDKFQMHKLKC